MARTATTPRLARHWCSCGRGFHNRAGMNHHAVKCPTEQARSAAFIDAIQAGRPLGDDAKIQLPCERFER